MTQEELFNAQYLCPADDPGRVFVVIKIEGVVRDARLHQARRAIAPGFSQTEPSVTMRQIHPPRPPDPYSPVQQFVEGSREWPPVTYKMRQVLEGLLPCEVDAEGFVRSL